MFLSFALATHAQGQSQGLFGGVRPDTAANTRLDFTTSVIQGYDTDVPAALAPAIDPSNLQTGGFSTILNTAAAYSWKNSRAQVGVNGNSAFRHYAELGETRGVGSGFGVGVSVRLPGRMTLMANQAGAYSPAYYSGLFPTGETVEPGSPGVTAPDYIVGDVESHIYSSTVSLRRDFTQRSSFTASGDFQYTDRRQESVLWQDASGYWLHGEYARNVSRNSAITTQYGYRSRGTGYVNELQTTEHTLDFGVNHSRSLSASRRVSLGFRVGASAADVPIEGTTVMTRQYLGNASVDFEYEFQRTWRARANYRRGIEYVTDIPEPVYADSVGMGIDGFLTRRVDFTVSAGYSAGDSIVDSSALKYDTYTGSVRVRYAFSRLAATYGEYLYYFYDFGGGAPLMLGVPRGVERQGVRAGLSLWMPALRK